MYARSDGRQRDAGNPGIWISSLAQGPRAVKYAGNPGQDERQGQQADRQSRPGAVGVQVNQRPGEHHQSACAVEPGRMAPPPDPGQVEGPACLFLPVFPAGATIRASGRRV